MLLAAGASTTHLSEFGSRPGERVPDVAVTTPGGEPTSLLKLKGRAGLVIVTRDTECPVSQRYVPRLDELASRYEARGFRFVLLDITPHSIDEARASASPRKQQLTIVDPERKIRGALKPFSTAEAFVIDAQGTLRYRGAIDDQYGLDFQRASPGANWLQDALEAVSRGEDPRVTLTSAKGCPQGKDAGTPVLRQGVTYHNRISRIIQANCELCHRVGGLGPMPLVTYPQVYERRAIINVMVSSGRMPPWFAHPKVGEWANDRSLGTRDRNDLLQWIGAGAPEGDPAEAPLPRQFAPGWNIGKPDAVIAIPEPLKVPAQGKVDYKNVYVKTDFAEDKWIAAVEIRPTQPKVVHHALAFLEEPGRRGLSAEDRRKLKPGQPIPPQPEDGVRTFFAATVPGATGMVFPKDTGKRLPKGAWIRFEIHYQPNGAEVIDRTEIGFRFASKPLREVQSASVFNTEIAIPPNRKGYRAEARRRFDEPAEILTLFPHMHLRGAAFRYELHYPDGKVRRLLEVPRYDFNWQTQYQAKRPIRVPRGAELVATAWYDNSRDNPWNPDPSKTVRWGVQSDDEMMIGYFDFIDLGSSVGVKSQANAIPDRSLNKK